MDVSEWPVVKEAKQAAKAQLAFYNKMMSAKQLRRRRFDLNIKLVMTQARQADLRKQLDVLIKAGLQRKTIEAAWRDHKG